MLPVRTGALASVSIYEWRGGLVEGGKWRGGKWSGVNGGEGEWRCRQVVV